MKGKIGLAAALLLTVPSMAHAQKKPDPVAPTVQPDWSEVRKLSESRMREGMYDPQSAQIEWLTGWQWGNMIRGWKREWGWVGCASLNGKNRMGGYVGATKRAFLFTEAGVLAMDNEWSSSVCRADRKQPLQAAFIDKPANGAPVSVADEIAKLADLRDKGVLTPAEFDAQKAKLLNP